MDKIDRVISVVRRLNEETTIGGGQIAGTKEAGDDPPVRVGSKRIYMKGLRKWWRQMTGENK